MIKFAFLSDTHEGHRKTIPIECDILCYTGDITNHGDPKVVEDFISWLDEYPARAKVFIAGNHDKTFDAKFCHHKTVNGDYLNEHIIYKHAEIKYLLKNLPQGVNYLENTGVNLFGYNIWGSPYSPRFGGSDWAFSKDRGEDIAKEWAKIPSNTHVLLTHGPAYGVLDNKVERGRITEDGLGCQQLASRVVKLNKLALHAFGHIHENYGTVMQPVSNTRRVMFVNSALQKNTSKLDFVNDKPIVIYA